jgi:hypothetical protein
MKKIFTLLSVVSLFAGVSAQTNVVNETFTFTGALKDNGWASHSGTAGQLLADGSKVNLVAGNGEDVNKAFSADYIINPAELNKTEYTLTLNVPSQTGLAGSTAAGEYFLMLSNQSGTSVANFYGRLFIRKSSGTGYVLGISNYTGTTVYSTVELPVATDVSVKVAFSVSGTNSTSTLTINNGTPITSTSAIAPTVLKSVVIRQAGSATAGTGNVSIDNLVVTTYPSNTLSVGDITKTKNIFLKNTMVDNTLSFQTKGNATVKVYNMNGQLVKSSVISVSNSTVDVASLPKGNYVVTSELNGEKVSQKVIKK